jgi:hypothetical protein
MYLFLSYFGIFVKYAYWRVSKIFCLYFGFDIFSYTSNLPYIGNFVKSIPKKLLSKLLADFGQTIFVKSTRRNVIESL